MTPAAVDHLDTVAFLAPPEHVDQLVPTPGDEGVFFDLGHALDELRLPGDDEDLGPGHIPDVDGDVVATSQHKVTQHRHA